MCVALDEQSLGGDGSKSSGQLVRHTQWQRENTPACRGVWCVRGMHGRGCGVVGVGKVSG